MPSSERASTADLLAEEPLGALTPAERTTTSVLPLTSSRIIPSAIGLRQIFPVQTKRILFMLPESP
jgi:hypothetical protein